MKLRISVTSFLLFGAHRINAFFILLSENWLKEDDSTVEKCQSALIQFEEDKAHIIAWIRMFLAGTFRSDKCLTYRENWDSL